MVSFKLIFDIAPSAEEVRRLTETAAVCMSTVDGGGREFLFNGQSPAHLARFVVRICNLVTIHQLPTFLCAEVKK